MAILENISVGDVTYYLVDDVPTHSASKGSVAIKKNTYESRVYVNNDGGTTWLKCLNGEYGEMYFSNFTTLRDTTQNTWSSLANITSLEGNLYGFGVTTNQLKYTGDTLSKFFTTISTTVRGGTAKWMDYEIGQSLNNIVPPLYQGATSIDNATWVKINSNRNVSIVNGQFLIGGVRWLNRESGGGAADRSYTARNMNITTHKIDEADTYFLENWETNSFTGNSWNVVNDTVNVWVVGTAENSTTGGTYSAYISNNGGTSATYTLTNAEVSHFYRDFEIPNVVDGVHLVFDWKSWGENAAGASQYDFGAVVMADTGTTPTAGVEVSTTQATITNSKPTGNGRIGAVTNLGKFNSAYGGADNTWRRENINLTNYKGQTKRIIFTWVNDVTAGNNPPFVVDNIKIQFF